jgi:hypothetical protein
LCLGEYRTSVGLCGVQFAESSESHTDATILVVQGKVELQRQEELLIKALEHTCTMQLGGAHGAAQGWGRALAVHIQTHQPDLVKLRSELGNRLAEASAAAGLVPMGVVAYVEV